MSRRIILKSPTSVYRGQSLLQSRSSTSSCSSNDGGSITRSPSEKSANFGEFCGGTTAACAAVCCCCPIGIANLLVLAIYKVPAGLCRRALRQKRLRNLPKKGLLSRNHRGRSGCDHSELQIHPVVCLQDFFLDVEVSEEAEQAVVELEKEMWQRFYDAGFWRSPSQRGESPSIKQQ